MIVRTIRHDDEPHDDELHDDELHDDGLQLTSRSVWLGLLIAQVLIDRGIHIVLCQGPI